MLSVAPNGMTNPDVCRDTPLFFSKHSIERGMVAFDVAVENAVKRLGSILTMCRTGFTFAKIINTSDIETKKWNPMLKKHVIINIPSELAAWRSFSESPAYWAH